MPNETRKQRVCRMLKRSHPTLQRQYGKRNLLNTRRNSNISQYTGVNTNENNLRTYLSEQSNESNRWEPENILANALVNLSLIHI